MQQAPSDSVKVRVSCGSWDDVIVSLSLFENKNGDLVTTNAERYRTIRKCWSEKHLVRQDGAT